MSVRIDNFTRYAALALSSGFAPLSLAQNGTIYYMDGFTQLGTDSFSATSAGWHQDVAP